MRASSGIHVYLVLIVANVRGTRADGCTDLQIVSFVNPNGVNCGASCNYYFELCVSLIAITSSSGSSGCNQLYVRSEQLYGKASVNASDIAAVLLTQSVTHLTQSATTGLYVRVSVWSYNQVSADHLVGSYEQQVDLSVPNSQWFNVQLANSFSSLTYAYRKRCDTDYYGAYCSTHCGNSCGNTDTVYVSSSSTTKTSLASFNTEASMIGSTGTTLMPVLAGLLVPVLSGTLASVLLLLVVAAAVFYYCKYRPNRLKAAAANNPKVAVDTPRPCTYKLDLERNRECKYEDDYEDVSGGSCNYTKVFTVFPPSGNSTDEHYEA